MSVLILIPSVLFLAMYKFLNASGPVSVLIFIELPLVLGYLERFPLRFSPVRLRFGILRFVLFFFLFASFLIFILLIPDTLYNAWLLLLNAGKSGGGISFAFVYAIGIVSSYGCTSLILSRKKGQAVLELLLMMNLVLLILYPRPGVFVLFLLLVGSKLFTAQIFRGQKIKSVLNTFILIIPALIIGFLLPLSPQPPRGNPVVDRISGSLQKTISLLFPDLPLMLNVPGYGTSYAAARKTGERPLLSSRVLFEVEGPPSSLYLKTDVFYTLSAQGWVPVPVKAPVEMDEKPDTHHMRAYGLTIEADLYTRLPVNGLTEYVEYRGSFFKVPGPAAFDPPGELPLVRDDQLILYNSSGYRLPEEDLESEIKRSLNVPDEIRNVISPLAHDLAGIDRETSLSSIKAFLQKNYTYSLMTKPSDRMIENFLFETHTGYCVHFSASAALLARTMGIPVRLAEGFLVQISGYEDEDGRTYSGGRSAVSVTGLSAHQWAEVLSDGRWIPWEVTPPFSFLGAGESEISYDDYTRNQLESLGIVSERTSGDDDSGEVNPALLPFLYTFSAAGLILWILFKFAAYRDRLSDRSLKRKLSRLTVKGEKKWGLPKAAAIGWIAWFGLCERRKPEIDRLVTELKDIVIRFLYSHESLDKDERTELLSGIRFLSGIMHKERQISAASGVDALQRNSKRDYNETGDKV